MGDSFDIVGSYVLSFTGRHLKLKLDHRLDEEICRILRKRFGCLCGMRPPYCSGVTDLVSVVLERCEEETG